MSCCWRPVAHQRPLSADGRTPIPNQLGVIPLNDQPETALPYSGEGRGDSVYLVGWRTEHERLFKAGDGKAAVIYRNSIDRTLRLDTIQAGQLPAPVVQELFVDTR